MDNITHTLIGIGLAKAGLSRRLGRGTTLILAVSSNLPDLDGVCLAFGPLGFLWRRMVTHSLPGGLLLALAASVIFRRIYPHLSLRTIFGLNALGIAAHIFADLWNSYGVVLYWPLGWTRISLDWVFILDVYIWAILALALSLALVLRRHSVWIWRGGLGAIAAYVGLCCFASQKSRAIVSAQTPSNSTEVFVYPEPFGPRHFRVVTRAGDDYAVYEVSPFQNHSDLPERFEAEQQAPVVSAARRSDSGQRLDRFFSTGVWRLASDGENAIVYGLGFRTKLFRARAPFVFRVSPDGHVWRAHGPFVFNTGNDP